MWMLQAADNALKQQRERQKESVVSGKRAADVVASLMQLRGDGGSEKSRNLVSGLDLFRLCSNLPRGYKKG